MAGERRALIIATGEYEDPKLARLRAPAADAERLARVLRNPDIGGFEVEVAHDEDGRSLGRRLTDFFRKRQPDDLVLVHISCHGIKDDRGRLYLAARDTEIDYPDTTGVSSDWLNDVMTRTRARRSLLLLDCCFAGRFPFGMSRRSGEDVGIGDHLGGRGAAVISASTATEYAYEGDQLDQLSGEAQGSVFTTALVEGLESGAADRDQDKWISVDELYDYVYDRVKVENPAQKPTRQGALEGNFYIARSVYEPPVEPAELDEELLALVDHPVPGARLGAVDELTRLLTSPNKSLVLAARLELERMTDDDSRRVADRVKAALAEEQGPRVTEEKESEEEGPWARHRESESHAAGWYVDPHRGEGQRYWDGSAWSEHRVPHGSNAPPGLYPNPHGGGNWRRWDGSRWTYSSQEPGERTSPRKKSPAQLALVCAVLLVVGGVTMASSTDPLGDLLGGLLAIGSLGGLIVAAALGLWAATQDLLRRR